jgi:hypothetical protein
VWRADNAKSGGVNWLQLNDFAQPEPVRVDWPCIRPDPDIASTGEPRDNGTNLYQGNTGNGTTSRMGMAGM